VETGEEGLVGKIGTAITDLRPGGRVFVHGETWDAVAAAPLDSGDPVRVVGVEGMTLRVEKA
jgi:membrane-bound serine protease (ClpP class)